MMFGWGLILLILILVVVFAVRGNRPGGAAQGREEDPAETALREEYARGAIDEETYRRRLRELRRD